MQIKLHHLFPTPVWALHNPQYAQMNPRLIARVNQLHEADPAGIKLSNVNGWHSPADLQDQPECRALLEWLLPQVLSIARQYKIIPTARFEVAAWANINFPGAMNQIHNHANAHFSGSYYLQVPENSGDIWFRDPRMAAAAIKPPIEEQTEYTTTKVSIKPEAGNAYVFPAWLDHGVSLNQSQHNRMGIAFNITVLS